MTSLPLKTAQRARAARLALAEAFPWTAMPLIVGAPMRVFTGPAMAVAIAHAGGLGFIGPGTKPESTAVDLAEVKERLAKTPLPSTRASKGPLLPVGVGFQVWNGDLESAVAAVAAHRPCAVWLFAPRDGQPQLDSWTLQLRQASPGTQIWIQVGTLKEAVAAASSKEAAPDALVIQGSEAGGHGRATDGIGIVSLLPEIADALALQSQSQSSDVNIPLVAAGGIADGRGVAAALGLGAAAAAMGTRFLAATEARINPAYQAEVVRATDGAANTGRTHLYNHLRGTFGWPAAWSPRGLRNASYEDEQAGVPFDELKARHDAAVQSGGSAAWGPSGRTATYAGASVGLVRGVADAADIVETVRQESREIISLL